MLHCHDAPLSDGRGRVHENLTLVDVPQIGSNGKRRQCGLSTTNVTRLGSQHAPASIFRLKNHDPQQFARGGRRICASLTYGFTAAVMTRLTGTFAPLCGRWCAHTRCGRRSPRLRAVRVSAAMEGSPSGGHWIVTTSLSQGNGNLILPQTRLIEGEPRGAAPKVRMLPMAQRAPLAAAPVPPNANAAAPPAAPVPD
jgi:hypothetical protein